MKQYAPFALLLVVLVTAIFSLFGDGSYERLSILQQNLNAQREVNADTRRRLASLEQELYGLQYDDRVLEKAARNELGLARQGELVFVFENFADTGE